MAQHGEPLVHPQRLQAMAGWALHVGDCQTGRTVPESGKFMLPCKFIRQNICVRVCTYPLCLFRHKFVFCHLQRFDGHLDVFQNAFFFLTSRHAFILFFCFLGFFYSILPGIQQTWARHYFVCASVG